jgi:hypothetical protein
MSCGAMWRVEWRRVEGCGGDEGLDEGWRGVIYDVIAQDGNVW